MNDEIGMPKISEYFFSRNSGVVRHPEPESWIGGSRLMRDPVCGRLCDQTSRQW